MNGFLLFLALVFGGRTNSDWTDSLIALFFIALFMFLSWGVIEGTIWVIQHVNISFS